MAEIRVCKKGEIAEGGTRLVKSGPVEIGVIFSKGAYYAYRNVCPHQGGPACEGLKMPQVVEKIGEKGVHLGMDFNEADMHIVCPWHGWEFDLRTGRHPGGERFALRRAKLEITDGHVYVVV